MRFRLPRSGANVLQGHESIFQRKGGGGHKDWSYNWCPTPCLLCDLLVGHRQFWGGRGGGLAADPPFEHKMRRHVRQLLRVLHYQPPLHGTLTLFPLVMRMGSGQ